MDKNILIAQYSHVSTFLGNELNCHNLPIITEYPPINTAVEYFFTVTNIAICRETIEITLCNHETEDLLYLNYWEFVELLKQENNNDVSFHYTTAGDIAYAEVIRLIEQLGDRTFLQSTPSVYGRVLELVISEHSVRVNLLLANDVNIDNLPRYVHKVCPYFERNENDDTISVPILDIAARSPWVFMKSEVYYNGFAQDFLESHELNLKELQRRSSIHMLPCSAPPTKPSFIHRILTLLSLDH